MGVVVCLLWWDWGRGCPYGPMMFPAALDLQVKPRLPEQAQRRISCEALASKWKVQQVLMNQKS